MTPIRAHSQCSIECVCEQLSTVCLSLQILEEWFGRTVIRSCTKLSYDHAQSMIENPTEKVPEEELPPISPEHSSKEVQQAVLNLHSIAKQLRQQRFVDGALRLDQVSPSVLFSATLSWACAQHPRVRGSLVASFSLPVFPATPPCHGNMSHGKMDSVGSSVTPAALTWKARVQD